MRLFAVPLRGIWKRLRLLSACMRLKSYLLRFFHNLDTYSPQSNLQDPKGEGEPVSPL
jgi:hypothetical protein